MDGLRWHGGFELRCLGRPVVKCFIAVSFLTPPQPAGAIGASLQKQAPPLSEGDALLQEREDGSDSVWKPAFR